MAYLRPLVTKIIIHLISRVYICVDTQGELLLCCNSRPKLTIYKAKESVYKDESVYKGERVALNRGLPARTRHTTHTSSANSHRTVSTLRDTACPC